MLCCHSNSIHAAINFVPTNCNRSGITLCHCDGKRDKVDISPPYYPRILNTGTAFLTISGPHMTLRYKLIKAGIAGYGIRRIPSSTAPTLTYTHTMHALLMVCDDNLTWFLWTKLCPAIHVSIAFHGISGIFGPFSRINGGSKNNLLEPTPSDARIIMRATNCPS